MSQDKDILFKIISKKELLKELIEILNEDENFKNKINFDASKVIDISSVELTIESKELRTDIKIETEDLVIMIEFQSTVLRDDEKRRFKLYVSAYDYYENKEDKDIIFCVVSTAEKSKTVIYRKENGNEFKFPLYSIKDLNSTEIFKNIKKQIKNNKKPSSKELLKLTLSPLIAEKQSMEKEAEKIAEFFKTLPIEKELKESIFSLSIIVSQYVLKDENPNKEKIIGVYMGQINYIEKYGDKREQQGRLQGRRQGRRQGIQQGRRQGIQQGRRREKKEIAKFLLKENQPIKQVAKITKLPINEVKRLRKKL